MYAMQIGFLTYTELNHVLRACGDDVDDRKRLLLMEAKAPEDVRLRGWRYSVESNRKWEKQMSIGRFLKKKNGAITKCDQSGRCY